MERDIKVETKHIIVLWTDLCEIMHSIQLLGSNEKMPGDAVDELEKSL